MMSNAPLIKLQERLGHSFSDQEKLKAALTHSSTRSDNNYERLEFLGDRVLGLVMATILFETFPDEAEGDLAKRHAVLVQGQMLANIAKDIGLGEAVILSDAERIAGGQENEHILADSMEAILGALYLDAGLDVCARLIKELWDETVHVMTEPPIDPKTALQEWAQGRGLPLPEYELVGKEGPDHAPVFEIRVTVKGHPPRISREFSMRKAEKQAAAMLLTYLEEKD